MVAGVFLVERTSQGRSDDRNKVRQVVCNEDDAQTDAQIIQAVIDTLNAATPVGDSGPTSNGPENVYPDGYFDTVTQIGTNPQGPINTDGDLLAWPQSVTEVDN